ncbi:MAG TPA: hypothetical protein VLH19_01500 [Patescibacteria group bacterium]|nr:hypothetical protein [Patescibacteria group bacterium]
MVSSLAEQIRLVARINRGAEIDKQEIAIDENTMSIESDGLIAIVIFGMSRLEYNAKDLRLTELRAIARLNVRRK